MQMVLLRKERHAFAEKFNIIPQSDPDQVCLLIPEVFSLRDNFDAVAGLIDDLRRTVLTERKKAYLYFNQLRDLEPAAALLLAAECFRCRSLVAPRIGQSVTGNYPLNADMSAQLSSMGFFRLLKVRDDVVRPSKTTTDGPSARFIGFRTHREVQAEIASDFCDLVTIDAFAMDQRTRGRMVAALKEAMGNAHEHAYSGDTQYPSMSRRWWITGHINPAAGEMMFMLLDQGIGIPRKLSPETFERIRSLMRRMTWRPSDGTMIAAATELHRTSTGQSTRGRGFQDMKRFIDSCDDGELRVLSNAGSYAYMKDRETIHDFDRSIGGTIIEWRVRHASRASVRDG